MPTSEELIGSTVEEIVDIILGYALGSSGDGPIDPNMRPSNVQLPGAAHWLTVTEHSQYVVRGTFQAPTPTAEKIMFWRRKPGAYIEFVNVRLTDGSSAPTATTGTTDNGQKSDILSTLSKAWTGFSEIVPTLMGPGKILDPGSIEDAGFFFQVIADYYQRMHDEMAAQIADLNRDDESFRGSASEMFEQRIQVAMIKVAGARQREERWREAVKNVYYGAGAFQRALLEELEVLKAAPSNDLRIPHNFVVNVFARAHMESTEGIGRDVTWYGDTPGQAVSATGTSNDSINDRFHAANIGLYISFPADFGGGPWNVFDDANWLDIDHHIRYAWAQRMLHTFPRTIEAARVLTRNIDAATLLLKPPPIGPNPRLAPRTEPDLNAPDPNDPNAPAPDLELDPDAGPEVGSALPDPQAPGLDDPTGGGGGADLDLAATDVGGSDDGPLLGANSPLLSTDSPSLGTDSPLLGSTLPSSGVTGPGVGTGSLGDLSTEQLGALQEAGLLDDIALTPEQSSDLAAAGIPAAAGATLGSLTPAQLSRLRSSGLLDNEQLTAADASALDAAGLGLPSTDSSLGLAELPTDLDLGLGPDSLGANLPSTQFPTAIDGLDVTSPDTGATLPGFALGDVTQPVAHTAAGGGAGVSTAGLSMAGGSGVSGGLGSGAPGASGLGTNAGSALGSADKSLVGTAGSGGAAGTSTAAGTPMPMPMGGGGMGGGGGGGGNEKSRERNTWLTEDEDVWGTDPDCAPAVIGRGDGFDVTEPVDVPDGPTVPGTARPTRTQPRRG
jgi:hypothetical protein